MIARCGKRKDSKLIPGFVVQLVTIVVKQESVPLWYSVKRTSKFSTQNTDQGNIYLLVVHPLLVKVLRSY